MLKVRLMGTKRDIKWFKKILERDRRIELIGVSEILPMKGTKKYRRMYAEVKKREVKR